MNTLKTGILLAALTGLFLAVGYLIGGSGGMVIAFLLALGLNAFSYWNADKAVLAMNGARPVSRAQAPELYDIVGELAAKAGLPSPKVYVIDSAQPNAFATGRDPAHAAVAASTGLLADLSREEIAGVMAHELAHVQHRDTLIMAVTATIAGAISMLANFALFFGGGRNNNLGLIGTIAMMILAPMAAALVQMAISRSREFEADRGGAEITGQPLWLASALQKIEAFARRTPMASAERNPATAHLFIVNPLSGARMASLFRTHPPTEERIAALREMAEEMGQPSAAPMAEPERREAPAGPWNPTGPHVAPPEAGSRGPWG